MRTKNELIKGYKRFRENYYKDNKELFIKLAEDGQFPKIAIISCCDSRVDPTIILDCQPGDLFVIRNVANLVPPCEDNESYHGTSAALEFAVTGLNVEDIIILGHTQCGGIKALVDGADLLNHETFIAKWMKQLAHVRNNIVEDKELTTQNERYDTCERHAINQSMKNLMSFPWIQTRVNDGKLKIHGWYYDLNDSELFVYDDESGNFSSVV